MRTFVFQGITSAEPFGFGGCPFGHLILLFSCHLVSGLAATTLGSTWIELVDIGRYWDYHNRAGPVTTL